MIPVDTSYLLAIRGWARTALRHIENAETLIEAEDANEPLWSIYCMAENLLKKSGKDFNSL